MLTVKYSKLFPASMVSHIDLLRVMNRIIRRSGLETEYSKGFNPHMLLFFSPPLSLGAESGCEYVSVAADKGDLTVEELNAVCPQGIVCSEFFVTEKNPNLAAEIKWAKYVVTAENAGKIDVKSILSKESYEITYAEKGENVTKDVRSFISDVKVLEEDKIEAVLACGNKNLKADRFIKGVMENSGLSLGSFSVMKTQAYVDLSLTADDFLKKAQNAFLQAQSALSSR